MRNARTCPVVVLSVGLAAPFVCAAAPSSIDGLQPAEVARALTGEWDGQLQVSSADGGVSTAPASMSAKLNPADNCVELYYEGFAFGRPVEGALVLSFQPNQPQVRVLDDAINTDATCRRMNAAQPDNDSLQLGCSTPQDGRFRVEFAKLDPQAWSISYQSLGADGEWSRMLSLQLDRLGPGQLSAAADGMARSPLLAQLREHSAVASVPTQD